MNYLFKQTSIFAFILLLSCSKEMPTDKDGQLTLQVIVSDQSEQVEFVDSLGYGPIPNAIVTLTSQKYSMDDNETVSFEATSNEQGVAVFSNIDVGNYIIYVEGKIVKDFETVEISGGSLAEVYEAFTVDTVKAMATVSSSLVINELYYTGPPNRAFYFYDQFVELYNASENTVYLDGLILCRAIGTINPDMETNDFVQAIYVYQFPGDNGGEEYPLVAGSFCVVATDAINHGDYIEGAADLSNADWEFYNPYKGDYDAPAANVVNALPETSVDFMISLAHNAVILARGDNYYPGELSSSGTQLYHIPLDDVLDAVEYSSSLDKNKEITTRVDAGFAGVGIAKYDGQSTERRDLGVDTNNSTVDFVTIEKPTPGYQHE